MSRLLQEQYDEILKENYSLVKQNEKLLVKLELAERALINLDRAINFKTMAKELELPDDIKTGTQLMIWKSNNDKINALNNAKRLAAEMLKQLKE